MTNVGEKKRIMLVRDNVTLLLGMLVIIVITVGIINLINSTSTIVVNGSTTPTIDSPFTTTPTVIGETIYEWSPHTYQYFDLKYTGYVWDHAYGVYYYTFVIVAHSTNSLTGYAYTINADHSDIFYAYGMYFKVKNTEQMFSPIIPPTIEIWEETQ